MGIGNPKRIGGRLPNGYKPEKARGKGNSAAATTFATGGSLAGIIIWARATFGDSLPWPIEADVGLGAGLTAAANWVAAWFLNRRKHNI